jgi:hypothetical protein
LVMPQLGRAVNTVRLGICELGLGEYRYRYDSRTDRHWTESEYDYAQIFGIAQHEPPRDSRPWFRLRGVGASEYERATPRRRPIR